MLFVIATRLFLVIKTLVCYIMQFLMSSPIYRYLDTKRKHVSIRLRNVIYNTGYMFHYFIQLRHLASIGGSTTKDIVDRIMSMVMSNPLACIYNWNGNGKKHGLSKLLLAKVIKGNTRSTFSSFRPFCLYYIKRAPMAERSEA